MDLVLQGGVIADGSGAPAFRGSVGIEGDRIGAVEQKPLRGATEIDAGGLVVAPGFIDVHSHSDLNLVVDGLARSKILQGVTTEVIGNCGFSAAPIADAAKRFFSRAANVLERAKVPWSWNSFAEYFRILERQGVALNVAALVGHGVVRASVMGFADRAPTTRELRRMRHRVERAMSDGAIGLSSGLIYPPGCYAKTEELVDLCRAVSANGGVYATHMRDEGDRLIEAVEEALTIGREARISVEISHHKAAGKANWGKVRRTIGMIRDARRQGVEVHCDVYPYTASMTGLAAVLPHWAHVGGPAQLVRRIRAARSRRRLVKALAERGSSYWQRIMIAYSKSYTTYEGRFVTQIARTLHKSPVDVVLDTIAEDYATTSMISFGMCEKDVQTVLHQPFTMIGSDASAVAPRGPLGVGKPHPRHYGTFPRVLARYVRERPLLSLEEAVRRMTSLPAEKFGINRRGRIAPGYYADLVVFDAKNITDRATYAQPARYPTRLVYVTVNGRLTVFKARHRGELAGRVLRKQSGI